MMDVAPDRDLSPHNQVAGGRRPAFDLKGVMASLTVIRLRTPDVAAIERQLRIKVAQIPQFFEDAPVVLDFSALGGGTPDFPFASLIDTLHLLRVIPVGVVGLDERYLRSAHLAGLALLRLGPVKSREATPAGRDPREAAAATAQAQAQAARQAAAAQEELSRTPPAAAVSPAQAAQAAAQAFPHRPPVVVRQPVRGGQVIYAQKTDLIVLAPVNPGAQVIADGHVHIYSTLRGRAMAGAQGLPDARIFCQKLEAELVAIAGSYVMAEEIPPAYRSKSVQILLEAGELRLQAL